MTWTILSGILGNANITQFENSGGNELNPQTLYNTAPFINDNSKASQTITYSNFDTATYNSSSNTKTLLATASSSLTVSFESLNTNIATVSGTTMTILTAGVVIIKATQAGDGSYDSATPIYCVISISREDDITGSTDYLTIPQQATATTQKINVASINIVIDNVQYTASSGVAYGYNTGFVGAVMIGSFTALDNNAQAVTDFSDYPLNISLTLPNANTANTLRMYKRETATTLYDPQPAGYPVTLTYNDPVWTGSLTSLSDVVIVDETPPAGSAGGDPYIKSYDGKITLLPNSWKKVLLFRNESVEIVGHCDWLTKDVISNLHFIQKTTGEVKKINTSEHKWVTDITYMTQMDVCDIKKNTKLVFDMINGMVLYDNSSFIYDEFKLNGRWGLYSLTHSGWYPKYDTKKYAIYFDDGSVNITIDKFWDDINFVELYLNKQPQNCIGEFIEHSDSNVIST